MENSIRDQQHAQELRRPGSHRSPQHLAGAASERVPLPATSYSSSAPLLPRSASTHAVALCFVGQFPRHQRLKRSVLDIFRAPPGGRNGFDGTGRELAFDAFIAMSTQEEEFEPQQAVDGRLLCKGLEAGADSKGGGGGFRRCEAELVPFNASFFAKATAHLGPMKGAQLFPLRTASFFSTVSRCARLVRRHAFAAAVGRTDHSRGARLSAEQAALAYYQTMVVTRFDVLDLVDMAPAPPPPPTAAEAAAAAAGGVGAGVGSASTAGGKSVGPSAFASVAAATWMDRTGEDVIIGAGSPPDTCR